MQRIVVLGTTGSGKTTMAERLAALLCVPAIDLDVLYWQPNWQGAAPEVFRQRAAAAVDQESWVISGNYSSIRDLIWSRADTLVWLDYSLPVIYWRLLRRTIRRIVTQENLWDTGNRESWRKQFFSRDSLFFWALKSRPRQRREYPRLLKTDYAHLQVIYLRSPRAAEQWLGQIERNAEASRISYTSLT
jgi:adenylate kinase family enzyme